LGDSASSKERKTGDNELFVSMEGLIGGKDGGEDKGFEKKE
jgi:hypothetical protein